ncbi:MAG TPA: DUF3263 domain-containing protein [Acidimicrobiia bacterium]|nr:DUF3263 domain-containing protein [Acidimicrobiia bacterium]
MLSAEDRAILDFERASWYEPGPKDQMIELTLGLSAAHYYHRLRVIVMSAHGYSYDPLTAKRVLRIIEPTAGTELAVS